MRLDKYIKVSRIIKRRTVAKAACDAGRVQLNGRPAKAGDTVKVDDVITIGFGDKELKARITSVSEVVKKDEAKELYEIIS